MKKCETRLKLQRRPLVDSPARTPDHQAGNRETSQSFKDTVGTGGMSTQSYPPEHSELASHRIMLEMGEPTTSGTGSHGSSDSQAIAAAELSIVHGQINE